MELGIISVYIKVCVLCCRCIKHFLCITLFRVDSSCVCRASSSRFKADFSWSAVFTSPLCFTFNASRWWIYKKNSIIIIICLHTSYGCQRCLVNMFWPAPLTSAALSSSRSSVAWVVGSPQLVKHAPPPSAQKAPPTHAFPAADQQTQQRPPTTDVEKE